MILIRKQNTIQVHPETEEDELFLEQLSCEENPAVILSIYLASGRLDYIELRHL